MTLTGYAKKNWCGTCDLYDADNGCGFMGEVVWEYFEVVGPKNRNRDKRVDSCKHYKKKVITNVQV